MSFKKGLEFSTSSQGRPYKLVTKGKGLNSHTLINSDLL